MKKPHSESFEKVLSNKQLLILIGFIIIAWIILGVIVIKIMSNDKEPSGLQIDKAYLKAIEPCQAEVNDAYVTTLINFADECDGQQRFFRHYDLKKRLVGATLWCGNTSKSFTFYYSNKWRQSNHER